MPPLQDNKTDFMLRNTRSLSDLPSNDSAISEVILHKVPTIPISRRTNIVILSGPNDGDIDVKAQQAQGEFQEFLSREWWHPRLISTAMFSIATVTAFLRMMPYTVISDNLGPLQIPLGSMVTKTSHFFLVLGVVVLSFAVGMTYLYSYYDAVDYYVCRYVDKNDICRAGTLSK